MSSASAKQNAGVFGALLGTTIGLKALMAVTGFVWVGFVLGHMVGNLQIFLPMPDDGVHAINKYAAMLKGMGGLLWAVRLGLLAAFAAHVWAAIKLGGVNSAARPVQYRDRKAQVSTFSSSYMRVSGFAILFFVLYHLAHFTLGMTDPGAFNHHLPNGMHDVYTMFILGFRNPIVAGLYVIANVLVAMHLHHAVSSIFQTLGLRSARYAPIIDKIGPTVGAIVAVGNLSMPVAVMLGLIGKSVQ